MKRAKPKKERHVLAPASRPVAVPCHFCKKDVSPHREEADE